MRLTSEKALHLLPSSFGTFTLEEFNCHVRHPTTLKLHAGEAMHKTLVNSTSQAHSQWPLPTASHVREPLGCPAPADIWQQLYKRPWVRTAQLSPSWTPDSQNHETKKSLFIPLSSGDNLLNSKCNRNNLLEHSKHSYFKSLLITLIHVAFLDLFLLIVSDFKNFRNFVIWPLAYMGIFDYALDITFIVLFVKRIWGSEWCYHPSEMIHICVCQVPGARVIQNHLLQF